MPTFNGTSGNDNLTGTDIADDMNGFAGDDIINSLGGDDVIHAGAGNDTIDAGASGPYIGIDYIYDEAGDDIVFGGADTDLMFGSPGNDTYDGGQGVSGFFGPDLDSVNYVGALAGIIVDLRLASGQVRSLGGSDAASIGIDTLANIETIFGSNFDDIMFAANGVAGNAYLYGAGGNDTLTGGTSGDLLDGGAGNDVIDGGGGWDTASYRTSVSGVIVSLAVAGPQETGQGTDTLISIEDLWGGVGNDVLTGSAVANVIEGDAGNDIIIGGGGNDILEDVSGDDIYVIDLAADHSVAEITDYDGFDEVRFASTVAGTLTMFAWDEGVDRIVIGTGLGVGADSTGLTALGVDAHLLGNGVEIIGNAGANSLVGTAFDDSLRGGAGADTMTGGAGDDVYHVDSAQDVVNEAVGGGNDTIIIAPTGLPVRDPDSTVFVSDFTYTLAAGQAIETLIVDPSVMGWVQVLANELANHLVGNDIGNYLHGGARNDHIEGLGGNDIIISGDGLDILEGGAGNDHYYVWNSNDIVVEHSGEGYDFIDVFGDYALAADAEVEFLWSGNWALTTPDVLTGNGFNQQIRGNNGDNHLSGLGGEDDLFGGFGADLLEGGLGADILHGEGGDDVLLGQDGSDALTGGEGADTFRGTKADLNGDTITDFGLGDTIVISDATFAGFTFNLNGNVLTYGAGSVRLEGVTGTIVASAAAGGGVQLTIEEPIRDVSNDFNGDGRSDVLWRNDNGTITDWLGQPNGSLTGNSGTFVAGVANDWVVAATGDFNGDLKDDILWRHANGTLTDWMGQASGSFTPNNGNFVSGVGAEWSIVSVGDFNGDQKDDILWRNANGTLTDWLGAANGGFTPNNGNFVAGVAAEWTIAATGDFNGDGKDDILWRNADGILTDWLGAANGGFTPNNGNFVDGVASEWTVAGAGDFNGDGKDDILWRNANGTLTNWLGTANGGFTPNNGNFVAGVGNEWTIAQIGDFNGDGKDDILWRNTNGTLTNWLGSTNGTFTPNNGAFVAGVGNDWHIQPPPELF